MGQDKRILGLKDAAKGCLTPEVEKFRSGVVFQSLKFQKFNKLRKTKGLGRMLPSGRRLPHHQLQNLSSELQNPPWFRSVGLGFDCYGL